MTAERSDQERDSVRASGPGEAARELHHVLRPFEAYALPRLAKALPSWVLPDHMTALGVISAFSIGACYALSGRSTMYLWLANALWVVNWVGDSLDGTLARVRRIERPRYGFYLDHLTDMFSAAAVCVGLGFSPYLQMPVALAILIGFYLLSINVYLETYVMGVFAFGYGLIGPTELRVLLVITGSLLALGLEPTIRLKGVPLGIIDLGALVGVTGMVLVLSRRVFTNLRYLARLEPPNVVKDPQSDSE